MKKSILVALLVFLLSACSLSTPPDAWRYKSADAFSAYVEDFMSGDDALAHSDLQRAIQNAKKSADLSSLARIYLGKCALNISVGIEDSCSEYQEISNLVEDAKLQNYYEIITKKSALPAETILDTNRVTSVLLNAALTKETLSNTQRTKMLELASLHGYKKAVLFWLQESAKYSKEQVLKERFNQTRDCLESKE